MKKLLDTRVKQITAGVIVVALVIGSGVGIWALTNKGNVAEDTPVVELTEAEKVQLEREEKFNDFLIAEGKIKIVEGTLDFDFSKVIQPDVDKVEVNGFDFNQLGVQKGTVTATVGTKKLSKPLTIEVISKENATEATKLAEVKFDEAKVKEVESGKVVSKDIVKDNGVADDVKPTTPAKPDTKPTEPSKPVEKPVEKPAEKPTEPSKPKPVVTTKEETRTEDVGYTTEYRDDATMLKGQTKTIQAGANGTHTIVYTVTYTDGKETNRVVKTNTVTTNPTVEIIARGTKEEVKAPTLEFKAHAAGYYTSRDAAVAAGEGLCIEVTSCRQYTGSNRVISSDGTTYWILYLFDKNYESVGGKGWSGHLPFTVSGNQVFPS